MNFLPVCLNVDGKRILIVGGGSVAERKLAVLLPYARGLAVCAPEITAGIRELGVELIERAYDPSVLEGADLVFACTDSRAVNAAVAADARNRRIPVCAVDDPEASDFISPAIHRSGTMSVAVSSNGEDVRRSIRWRDRIRQLEAEGRLG